MLGRNTSPLLTARETETILQKCDLVASAFLNFSGQDIMPFQIGKRFIPFQCTGCLDDRQMSWKITFEIQAIKIPAFFKKSFLELLIKKVLFWEGVNISCT